jgi:hypothetical protein
METIAVLTELPRRHVNSTADSLGWLEGVRRLGFEAGMIVVRVADSAVQRKEAIACVLRDVLIHWIDATIRDAYGGHHPPKGDYHGGAFSSARRIATVSGYGFEAMKAHRSS